MSICRDLQGQGYGTLLPTELERQAFGSATRALHLEVANTRLSTLAFYRNRGYRESGQSAYRAIETIRL